ncbi:MAG: hypothetical protein ABID35_07830, partial [Candidatus Margulisiibacteriota bacterium]
HPAVVSFFAFTNHAKFFDHFQCHFSLIFQQLSAVRLIFLPTRSGDDPEILRKKKNMQTLLLKKPDKSSRFGRKK